MKCAACGGEFKAAELKVTPKGYACKQCFELQNGGEPQVVTVQQVQPPQTSLQVGRFEKGQPKQHPERTAKIHTAEKTAKGVNTHPPTRTTKTLIPPPTGSTGSKNTSTIGLKGSTDTSKASVIRHIRSLVLERSDGSQYTLETDMLNDELVVYAKTHDHRVLQEKDMLHRGVAKSTDGGDDW